MVLIAERPWSPVHFVFALHQKCGSPPHLLRLKYDHILPVEAALASQSRL